jgi:hypothetical protein
MASDGTLTLTGKNSDYLEVFTIQGSSLCSASTTKVVLENVVDSANVIINVIGESLSCGGYQIDGVTISRTVWNFCSASSLSFHNVAWFGAVLAPFADITNPDGVVWGQVFANSWTAEGDTCMQQNWIPFEGCIDSCLWYSASSFCTFSQEDFVREQCNPQKRVDGCYSSIALKTKFDKCFPIGVRVGTEENSLALTSFDAVADFLPQSGEVGVLDTFYINPTETPAGIFAGEMIALAISIGLDKCTERFATACASFDGMVVCSGEEDPCHAFSGLTIGQIFHQANGILGGIESQVSADTALKCVQHINAEFRGCVSYMSQRHEFGFCSCNEQTCEAKPPSIIELEKEFDNPDSPVGSSSLMLAPMVAFLLASVAATIY